MRARTVTQKHDPARRQVIDFIKNLKTFSVKDAKISHSLGENIFEVLINAYISSVERGVKSNHKKIKYGQQTQTGNLLGIHRWQASGREGICRVGPWGMPLPGWECGKPLGARVWNSGISGLGVQNAKLLRKQRDSFPTKPDVLLLHDPRSLPGFT